MSRFKDYWNSIKTVVSPIISMDLSKDKVRAPEEFIGRTVLARRTLTSADEEIVIEDVRPCIGIDDSIKEFANPLLRYYQINGTHFCSMLSYFIQLVENRLPTDEEMAEFNLASDVKDIRDLNGEEKN